MSDSPTSDLARVVVTGVAPDGRSVIEYDGEATPWVRRPTGTLVMDLLSLDSLPPTVDARSTSGEELVLSMPLGGLAVRTTVFPPDSSISAEAAAAYAAAMAEIYGDQGSGPARDVPGMHRTDTVDVMTVVDGEIWCVMEDGETLLRQGESIVQRGTWHAWQNRSTRVCRVVTTMIAATRDPE